MTRERNPTAAELKAYKKQRKADGICPRCDGKGSPDTYCRTCDNTGSVKPKKAMTYPAPSHCDWHPAKRPYIQWHDWAAKQVKLGHRQKRCPDCQRLFFKSEYGVAPRGLGWRSI